MKRLILALCALVLTLPAMSVDYTVSTNQAREKRLDRSVRRANRLTCGRVGLLPTCSQVEARTKHCEVTGFGSVTDCPKADTFTIVTNRGWLQDVVDAAINQHGERAEKEAQQAVLDAASKATATQRDAACRDIGLEAGCLP